MQPLLKRRLLIVFSLLVCLIPLFYIVYFTYAAATSTDYNYISLQINAILAIIQIITIIGLGITAWLNYQMADAARHSTEVSDKTLKHIMDVRDEETAPYILVYFEIPYGDTLVYLVIKNIGKSPARDIHIECNPHIQSTLSHAERYSPITRGIPSLAPHQEIRTIFDVFIDRMGANLPMTYTIKLMYKGGIGNRQRQDEQIADISMYNSRMFAKQKDFQDLVKATEKMSKAVTSMANQVRQEHIRRYQREKEIDTLGDRHLPEAISRPEDRQELEAINPSAEDTVDDAVSNDL